MYVHGVGVGVPTLRVATADIDAGWDRSGRRGQVAVCAPDEDVLTLSWAAATMALAEAGIDAADVDGLWWGTTRPPYAEGPSHAVLIDALGLDAGAAGCITSGSTHAGMDALLAAADAVAAGSAGTALVIAADALRPGLGTGYEARCGAAAVALVLRADTGPAAIGARTSFARPFLDRYRGDGETDTRDVYDGRLFREEVFVPIVTEAARRLTADAGDGSNTPSWSLPDPDGRLAAAVARKVGADPKTLASAGAYTALGDTGAAAALVGLVGALASPGTAHAIGYGGGRASGVTITATAAVPGAGAAQRALEEAGRPTTYAALLRARNQLTPNGETIPMGVPPESAMFTRGADEMLQLLGGRCVDCGTISTPPSIHPHCIACGGPKLEPVALAREGTVHTYVVNHTMPAPFEAPLPIAVIDLDDGARVMLQVADDGTNVEIGRRMRLVLRKYAHERGVPVYGYKALPMKEGS
ncbi:MAG TPA: OB-fold domain-containing protein [Acidimicrobiia bacterium]|jgi:hydroxymethylglutaryl-CoA synthase